MEGVKKVVKDYLTSLTNSAGILLVSVAEVLISQTVFVCPCHPTDTANQLLVDDTPTLEAVGQRKHYALSFIIWPAVASFFLAVMLSGHMLRCLIDHRFTASKFRHHCRGVKYGLQHASSIMVLPATWIFVVLMDGGFYTCAVTKAPDHCLPAVDTLDANTTLIASRMAIVRENQWYRSESQIIALTMVGVIGTIIGFVVICTHLCSTLPYYQRNYMKLYREKELESFKTVSEKSLTKELKAKWECFFKDADLGDWEAISALPSGSPILHKGQFYYSALHSWRNVPPETDTFNVGHRPASGGRDERRVKPDAHDEQQVKPDAGFSRYPTKEDERRYPTKDDLRRYPKNDDERRYAKNDDERRYTTNDDERQ